MAGLSENAADQMAALIAGSRAKRDAKLVKIASDSANRLAYAAREANMMLAPNSVEGRKMMMAMQQSANASPNAQTNLHPIKLPDIAPTQGVTDPRQDLYTFVQNNKASTLRLASDLRSSLNNATKQAYAKVSAVHRARTASEAWSALAQASEAYQQAWSLGRSLVTATGKPLPYGLTEHALNKVISHPLMPKAKFQPSDLAQRYKGYQRTEMTQKPYIFDRTALSGFAGAEADALDSARAIANQIQANTDQLKTGVQQSSGGLNTASPLILGAALAIGYLLVKGKI